MGPVPPFVIDELIVVLCPVVTVLLPLIVMVGVRLLFTVIVITLLVSMGVVTQLELLVIITRTWLVVVNGPV